MYALIIFKKYVKNLKPYFFYVIIIGVLFAGLSLSQISKADYTDSEITSIEIIIGAETSGEDQEENPDEKK